MRIDVVRPEGLIRRLDRLRAAGRYEPEALAATTIVASGADRIDQGAFVSAFLNYGAGERAADLRRQLRAALATPESHDVRVFHDGSGRLLGTLIQSMHACAVEVKLARVSATDRVGRALGRQLAYLPRQAAADARLERARVTDPNPSPAVQNSLADEAYVETDDGEWICEIGRGLVETADELAPIELAQIERRQWPRKMIGAGMPVFMLSINASWAEQLFDTNLAADTLFGRSVALGLSREHVYYRRPAASGGITHPARILWYVKGGIPSHPVGHLRAASRLEEVVIGSARALHRRFERLGVWDAQQVNNAADANGEVMALRFVDTELFQMPLSLRKLRQTYAHAGVEFTAPQSPRRVPEHMFCLLYRQASAYA